MFCFIFLLGHNILGTELTAGLCTRPLAWYAETSIQSVATYNNSWTYEERLAARNKNGKRKPLP
jgi:hypothetical protein